MASLTGDPDPHRAAPGRWARALLFIRLLDRDPPLLRVDGQVVVATEVVVETADRDELEGACGAIAGMADDFAARLREAVVST